MRNTRHSSKKAAKAKLSGFAVSDGQAKNKKILFDETTPNEEVHDDDDAAQESTANDQETSDDESVVEEVKGSIARESTQKLRDEERQIAKLGVTSKKRPKKKEVVQEESESSSDNEDDAHEDDVVLTDDFFKTVDSERADKLQSSKEAKRQKKKEENKLLVTGKHTTFVVQDEHNHLLSDTPKKVGQNIQVITLGNGDDAFADDDEEDKRILLSATLGSASAASSLFARGNLSGGASMKRSCDSRKRGTNDDEAWKRSKRVVYRTGCGRAAVLFCKQKK